MRDEDGLGFAMNIHEFRVLGWRDSTKFQSCRDGGYLVVFRGFSASELRGIGFRRFGVSEFQIGLTLLLSCEEVKYFCPLDIRSFRSGPSA